MFGPRTSAAILGLTLALSGVDALGVEVRPRLDLRVRQEFLEDVYAFAPDDDRNWIRVRTRAGGFLQSGPHRFDLRLTNENRQFIVPEHRFHGDEIIFDNFFWRWSFSPEATLTVGRQDIVWPGGLLMLEGHPLDGSRSIYQNAIRVQGRLADGRVDVSLVHNPKRDDFVLVDDRDLALSDADETGGAIRYARPRWATSLIVKGETDPDGQLDDLTTITGSLRLQSRPEVERSWHAELVLQRQNGTIRGSPGDRRSTDDGGWAVAADFGLRDGLGLGFEGELEAAWYSALDEGLRPFRTPWGRWPKWSEMYIYTQIGESTAGRTHVAAWEDLALARATLRRRLDADSSLRLSLLYLAETAVGLTRGWMTQSEWKLLLGHGVTGHLLWEFFAPGNYHDGRFHMAPLDPTLHFVRWQLSWAL